MKCPRIPPCMVCKLDLQLGVDLQLEVKSAVPTEIPIQRLDESFFGKTQDSGSLRMELLVIIMKRTAFLFRHKFKSNETKTVHQGQLSASG